EAVVPAVTGIELTDEVEQARGRGVEVGRQLGDLVTQLIQRERFHRESPFCWGDSTPGFRSHLRGTTGGDRDHDHIFRDEPTDDASPASADRWAGVHPVLPTRGECP